MIDDEDDIREIAKVCLETVGGWEVITASCGRDGLARASVEQPHVILLDVMMPEMDGPTTFAHLQNDPATKHIPVILLTAKIQTSDLAEFALLDVTGVLAKPFDPLALSDEIDACLRLGSSARRSGDRC